MREGKKQNKNLSSLNGIRKSENGNLINVFFRFVLELELIIEGKGKENQNRFEIKNQKDIGKFFSTFLK